MGNNNIIILSFASKLDTNHSSNEHTKVDDCQKCTSPVTYSVDVGSVNKVYF